MTTPEARSLALARELHDTVLQEFLVIMMQLRRIEHVVEPEAAGRIDFGLQAASRGIDCVRQLLTDLRTPGQLPSNVEPANPLAWDLATVLHAVLAPAQLRRSFRCAESIVLPRSVQREVVRIVHEAGINIVRHACARRVVCRVALLHGVLHVVVRDDGCGMAGPGRVEGFGVTGMRERAAIIGALLRFDSHPGGGTTMHLAIPTGSSPLGDHSRWMLPPPQTRRDWNNFGRDPERLHD